MMKRMLLLAFCLIFLFSFCSNPKHHLKYFNSENGIIISWDSIFDYSEISHYELFINDSLLTEIKQLSNSIDSSTLWFPVNGVIKVEAERYNCSGWTFSNKWKGYSGKGYMVNHDSYNTGEEAMVISEAENRIPLSSQYIIKFKVVDEGYYRMDAKWAADNSEANDLWLRFTEKDNEYHKIGRIIRDEQKEAFLYNGWNLEKRYLKKGTYKAFFAPRSVNLCLDFMVVHKVTEEPITDTSDFANEKYGYWIINSISPDDKKLVEQTKKSFNTITSYFIEDAMIPKTKEVRIKLVPFDLNGNRLDRQAFASISR